MGDYNIGDAAIRSGVSAKMIRHYEAMGLIPKARRTAAGYRNYAESDVHILRFIARARDLGFSMRQIGDLLGLWQNRRRRSNEVKALALAHIAEMEARIGEVQAMKATLEHLVHCCHGDERPRCPILDNLAGAKVETRPASTAKRVSASHPRTIGSSLRRPSTRR
jgi:MerR family copper efflux transcriptional regulator